MKSFILSIIIFSVLFSLSYADEGIGVFVNSNTNCIQFIDPATNEVSEPLLKGELGNYRGNLLDVAITSDGKTAVVTNVGDGKLFFIDISRGFDAPPTVLGSVFTGILNKDIAITPDDSFVLVNGFFFENKIAIVNLKNRTFLRYHHFPPPLFADAIEITPDGTLVLMADYLGGAVHSFQIDRDANLSFKETQVLLPFWPINLSVSPDRKTVIVLTAHFSVASIFSIDSQQNLCFIENIPLPAKTAHACVFTNDGDKAYIYTCQFSMERINIPEYTTLDNNTNPARETWVHQLNVNGPGRVTNSGTSIKINPNRNSGFLFCVDTMAIDPSGNFLYVTNPYPFATIGGISVIDLNTHTEVDFLSTTGFPVGIAFTTINSRETVE